jgi:hypothetical protein
MLMFGIDVANRDLRFLVSSSNKIKLRMLSRGRSDQPIRRYSIVDP